MDYADAQHNVCVKNRAIPQPQPRYSVYSALVSEKHSNSQINFYICHFYVI